MTLSDPHTIRLRGPWKLEPLSETNATEQLPVAVRQKKLPADWSSVLGADYRGAVRYTRSFHKPAGLEELEQVWIAVEPPRSQGEIALNGQQLGTVALGESTFRQEITPLLVDFNELAIVVTHPEVAESDLSDDTGCGGLIGEVRLEIGFPNRTVTG